MSLNKKIMHGILGLGLSTIVACDSDTGKRVELVSAEYEGPVKIRLVKEEHMMPFANRYLFEVRDSTDTVIAYMRTVGSDKTKSEINTLNGNYSLKDGGFIISDTIISRK